MRATRIVLTMLIVLARTASAQAVDLVVFGPSSPKQLDAACTASPECVATAGAEAHARRALAITITGTKVSFVLVDVAARELIAKRDVTIAARRIASDLPREQKKFLDDAPNIRAKTLFDAGNRHYELGEYAQALEIYKTAYRAKPLPAFQFNIAQCHRKLGQHTEAIQMYQAYLVGVPDAPNKELVESLIAESRNQIAAAEKAARDAEQARLDTEAKKAEDARLAAEAARRAKEADAKAEVERRKQLQMRVDAARQHELDKTYNQHPARPWMIATGAIGLATAGAGGYFAYRMRTHQSSFDDAGCGEPAQSLPESKLDACRDDIDQGRKDARLANILLGVGGGVTLASVLVYILDPGNLERPKERATLSITPTSVQVMVRW